MENLLNLVKNLHLFHISVDNSSTVNNTIVVDGDEDSKLDFTKKLLEGHSIGLGTSKTNKSD